VLGVAGLIEAFVSPTTIAAPVKLAVGLSGGLALWSYVLFAGRRSPDSI
jgi:hypothetical protein